jgi:ABC-type antimicrobial peptide transport system permease subunit
MMIIKSQDSFMRNYDAGVDKDRVIVLENSITVQKHSESFKTELLTIPGIEAVSITNCIPTRGASISTEVSWEGKDLSEKLHFWCINSDFDYNQTVQVKIIEGRFFNPAFSTDSNAFVINDVAAGVMKNKNPVGTTITVDGQKGTIIGVFKDFHCIDLAGPVVPAIIRIRTEDRPTVLVKYSSGSFHSITAKIEAVFKHYQTGVPYQATLFRDLTPFTDLSLPSNLVGLAFIIALFLACMGLFGLASFTSENRTKEIGIRKANGATTAAVMSMLLSTFTKWIVIAFFIALPVAVLLGKSFLGRFYFHAPLPVWAFIAGPLMAVIVALLTVSSQTWSVANRNPVRALRYE